MKSADIAIVCTDDGYWINAARHLLTCLGLPQVTCVLEGQELPKQVHTVVLFGPESLKIGLPSSVSVWTFSALFALKLEVDSELYVVDDFSFIGKVNRKHQFTRIFSNEERSHENSLEEIFFWLMERLNKHGRELSDDELLEWLIMVHDVGIIPNRKDYLFENILGLLAVKSSRWSQPLLDIVLKIDISIAEIHHQLHNLISLIADRIENHEDFKVVENDIVSTRKYLLRHPAFAFLLSSQFDIQHFNLSPQKQIEIIKESFSYCINAKRLISFGSLALSLGFAEFYNNVTQLFEKDEWCHNNSLLPLNSPNSSSLLFSPLLVIWYYRIIKRSNSGYKLKNNTHGRVVLSESVIWLYTQKKQIINGIEQVRFCLVDEDQNTISKSLLDNWLLYHKAPFSKGHKYTLSKENYGKEIYDLECAWLAFFKYIQLLNNKPFVKLFPWPPGYTNALSLRYDVDRYTTTDQVDEILDIQLKYFGTMCGSWFFLKSNDQLAIHKDILCKNKQEIGLHLEKAIACEAGKGVTHHSASTSHYWEGNATNYKLNRDGCIYGEFLSQQTFIPKITCIDNNTNDNAFHLGNLWSTPIHFPLEGSCSDSTLDYFNRLRKEFSFFKSINGHIIIGSHPDLNQSMLIDLAKTDEFSDCWCVPVADAVKRCQSIFTPGNIEVNSMHNSKISIVNHVSELESITIMINWPERKILSYNIDFNANQIIEIESSI